MGETEWHGWSKRFKEGGVASPALHVGPTPGRKQMTLYSVDGATQDVLAYFPTEEQAQKAMGILDSLIFGGSNG